MTTAPVKPPSPPAQDAPQRTRWGLWAQGNFRRLWIGETTSGLGTAVGNVALAWWPWSPWRPRRSWSEY